MKGFVALCSGVLFAIGLGLSGMTQPHVVRGFLDFFGDWNWRLLGVMIGAISVHALTYRLILKRAAPILEVTFMLPKNKNLDKRLIIGAIIFGLGWGWVGICPGPGLVASVSGNKGILYFVASMLIGMKCFQILDKKFFSVK